ncbi:hypothetical protein K439DRAFT_1664334 [Ramaria rubella]|nr:hypothetical protein K439DRAFT_1664334 [Ramaria rubella]
MNRHNCETEEPFFEYHDEQTPDARPTNNLLSGEETTSNSESPGLIYYDQVDSTSYSPDMSLNKVETDAMDVSIDPASDTHGPVPIYSTSNLPSQPQQPPQDISPLRTDIQYSSYPQSNALGLIFSHNDPPASFPHEALYTPYTRDVPEGAVFSMSSESNHPPRAHPWINEPRNHPLVQSGKAYICVSGACAPPGTVVMKKGRQSHNAQHHGTSYPPSTRRRRQTKRAEGRKKQEPYDKDRLDSQPGPSTHSEA